MMSEHYDTNLQSDHYCNDCNQHEKEIESLQSRLDAKSAALVKFGRHLPTCAKVLPVEGTYIVAISAKQDCTCEFDAAKNK
jgi:hypothetical protein